MEQKRTFKWPIFQTYLEITGDKCLWNCEKDIYFELKVNLLLYHSN